MVRAIVIGGTSSGVGKTTIAAGLTVALARRGYRVQTFKVGPDYIDPSYLTVASGSPCRNLDAWLLSHKAIVELFLRASSTADVAIIEGVMGLFDGHSPDNDIGSTAEVAKLLKAPVVMVADASKVARSIAATVLGFQAFDSALDIAGVIFNGVSGEGHLYFVKGPVEHATHIPVLGYLPRRDDLQLPERHLGLVPTTEKGVSEGFLDRLAHQVEQTIDVERLLGIAPEARVSQPEGFSLFPQKARPRSVRIAVAQDEAFGFYYQDSLDLLTAWGADVIPFSPLADQSLPDGVAGVYIGGGFPELFARELASNEPIKASLRHAASRGMPIYGECGGLMYLGDSLVDFDEREFSMVRLVPAKSIMSRSRLSIGYRTVQSLADGPLLKKGDQVRGHEFHWSELSKAPNLEGAAYIVAEKQGTCEGFQVGSVLASYIHLHMGSKPGMASSFVETCRKWSQS